eukprot:jgi/Mesvir1/16634/Mv10168-RA.1
MGLDLGAAIASEMSENEDHLEDQPLQQMGRHLLGAALPVSPSVKEALLAIKAGLKDGNNVLRDWTSGSDPCINRNWAGVICDGVVPWVTDLSLTDSGLSGTIHPPLFGSLTELATLEITSNSISGHLHEVSGFNLKGIPELLMLTSLVVRNNKMSGELPSGFANPGQVKTLQITNTRISGFIPYNYGGLNSPLTTINLSTNRLWGTIPHQAGQWNLIQYGTIDVSNNPGLCGSVGSLPGAFTTFQRSNTSLLLECPFDETPLTVCINTQPVHDEYMGTADWGCPWYQPVCFDQNNKPGAVNQDMDRGYQCAGCVDSEEGGAKDFACTDDYPICYENHDPTLLYAIQTGRVRGPSDGDFEEGVGCVACIDSAEGAGLDDGCAGQKDYVFGKDNANICYDGGASDGDFSEGEALSGFLIDGRRNFADKIAPLVCTVCIDDENGSTPDTGCRGTSKPYCLDWSPYTTVVEEGEGDFEGVLVPGFEVVVIGEGESELSPFLNNADNGFGIMCTDCVDDSDAWTTTLPDAGCTDPEKPFCWPVLSSAVFAFPTNNVGHCVKCFNDQYDWAVDKGCTESSPRCIQSRTMHTIFTDLLDDGEASGQGVTIPIASHARCVACKDSTNNEEVNPDEFCNSDAPFCVFADENDQYGAYCSPYANPVCLFDIEDAEPADATCLTDTALFATIIVHAENCTVTSLDLERLVGAMSSVLELPRCSVELTLAPPGDTPRRRNLLQTDIDIYPINLLFKAYVANVPNGTALLEVFKTVELAALLALFESDFGDIISISANDIMVVQLVAATSDPHFVTPSGFKFDFNGRADQTFCIVTADRLQINARFMGAADSSSAAQLASDARTWMDQVAILSGNDKVLVEAASAPGAPYSTSFGTVRVNGISGAQ